MSKLDGKVCVVTGGAGASGSPAPNSSFKRAQA